MEEKSNHPRVLIPKVAPIVVLITLLAVGSMVGLRLPKIASRAAPIAPGQVLDDLSPDQMPFPVDVAHYLVKDDPADEHWRLEAEVFGHDGHSELAPHLTVQWIDEVWREQAFPSLLETAYPTATVYAMAGKATTYGGVVKPFLGVVASPGDRHALRQSIIILDWYESVDAAATDARQLAGRVTRGNYPVASAATSGAAASPSSSAAAGSNPDRSPIPIDPPPPEPGEEPTPRDTPVPLPSVFPAPPLAECAKRCDERFERERNRCVFDLIRIDDPLWDLPWWCGVFCENNRDPFKVATCLVCLSWKIIAVTACEDRASANRWRCYLGYDFGGGTPVERCWPTETPVVKCVTATPSPTPTPDPRCEGIDPFVCDLCRGNCLVCAAACRGGDRDSCLAYARFCQGTPTPTP